MFKPIALLLVVLVAGVGIGYQFGQKSPSAGDCLNSVLGG